MSMVDKSSGLTAVHVHVLENDHSPYRYMYVRPVQLICNLNWYQLLKRCQSHGNPDLSVLRLVTNNWYLFVYVGTCRPKTTV